MKASAHPPKRLLVAASGTGGHLFPAIATAEYLDHYQIEWLGVPERLENHLVPQHYPLHIVDVEGFQQKGLANLGVLAGLIHGVWQVRQILQRGQFQGVFTTGGYISAPAILAARWLGLPVILHESNVLPGKVTKFLSRWCDIVALGFSATAQYLPHARKTVTVGTPVRADFLSEVPALPLPIPADAAVIVVVGGSQGAVSVNQLVRQAAPQWFEQGAWVVHLTGTHDPDRDTLKHPQYLEMAFFDQMAALFRRADLVISRSGAGTLTELAMTHTPSILIPYPYAAEDHQTYNARAFTDVGAAVLLPQDGLTAELLADKVLYLFQAPEYLEQMAQAAGSLAVVDSAIQLANLIQQTI
ncbi:MAG: undecaprenyldiphospho-muramoylpentapeptide beta-N-acetylglucosaminyltransferase [Oscillatoriales cyanobacterium RM2_1_1]|nr:undecaprenyldiphospho-muramoylpentapeptide beta-N-acetylglucosaminyltransferase [Oscillatoriales cyanobacterium RM2_1_1]